jgi:hypothetical protein
MRTTPYSKRAERAMLRDVRLRELGYADYHAYLHSPAWRDLKRRYYDAHPAICMCGDTNVHLHHKTYERVGREELDDLVPLCERCHEHVHALEAAGVIDLDLQGFYYDRRRAMENVAREAERKAEARADFDAYDERRAAQERRRQKKAERGRQFMRNRKHETPEERERRRERAAANARAQAKKREPMSKRAARVDANRPMPPTHRRHA